MLGKTRIKNKDEEDNGVAFYTLNVIGEKNLLSSVDAMMQRLKRAAVNDKVGGE